ATAIGSHLYRRQLAHGKTYSNAALLTVLPVTAFLPVLLNDPRLDLRTFGVEVSLFPFCAVLGYLTPKIIDQYSGGDAQCAGQAYAINVIGCVLGPLFASYLFLPWWGVKVTLVLLVIPIVFLWWLESAPISISGRATVIASLLGLFFLSGRHVISYE